MTEINHKRSSGAHREMKLAAFDAVMRAVRDGAQTRREIQAQTHLSWGSTSQCVNRLLEITMLEALDVASEGEGRPPGGVTAPTDRYLATAVEVQPAELVGVTMNLAGKVVAEHRLACADAGDNAAMEERLEAFAGVLARSFRAGAIRELHVVLTGAVDPVRRIWRRTPQLPRVAEFTAAAFAAKHPELALYFEHDVTARARETVRQLPECAEDGFIFFHIGRGVGMAVCEEGRFLRGVRGMAGEIGHLPLGNEALCSCGNTGCVESAFYPANLFAGAGIARTPGAFPDYAAALEEPELAALQDILCERVMWLLLAAVNLFDPPCLIAGGEILAPARRRLQAEWPEYCRRRAWAAPEVPLHFYDAVAGAAAVGSARAGVERLTTRLLRETV